MLDRSAEIERGQALLARLVAAGYDRAEPPVLQPAAVFLDQSGEDIRGRLYLTSDAAGGDFCLRPEYTIPVFRIYLASAPAGRPAGYSYMGPVFRFRPDGSGEFMQAGLESFGRTDREAADAEILSLALEAAEAIGERQLETRIGDAGLFLSLLDALDLPDAWRRRVRRGHAQGRSLEQTLAETNGASGFEHAGVLAALANADRAEARALVEDLLSIAGISSVGGRSAAEIAERFLEQASARGGAGISAEQREALARFLEISGDPDTSSAALRALAKDAGLDLEKPLDDFDARLNFIAARGLDLERLAFSTRFGRRLDYYTGFVFEAVDPKHPDQPILGGGRYDRLSRALGASEDIPAVGASIWCERLFAPPTFEARP
jgi:ATP phosphoribosyltransferase regulatory subunit